MHMILDMENMRDTEAWSQVTRQGEKERQKKEGFTKNELQINGFVCLSESLQKTSTIDRNPLSHHDMTDIHSK